MASQREPTFDVRIWSVRTAELTALGRADLTAGASGPWCGWGGQHRSVDGRGWLLP